MVRPYGSENHDRFLRFRLFLFLGKVSANTSTVLWVSSDLEPNEREKKNLKKKKKQRRRRSRGRRRQWRRWKKAKMKKSTLTASSLHHVNPSMRLTSRWLTQASYSSSLFRPHLQMLNPLLHFFFFFFCLSFVLIFSFMNPSCQACDCVGNDRG